MFRREATLYLVKLFGQSFDGNFGRLPSQLSLRLFPRGNLSVFCLFGSGCFVLRPACVRSAGAGLLPSSWVTGSLLQLLRVHLCIG